MFSSTSSTFCVEKIPETIKLPLRWYTAETRFRYVVMGCFICWLLTLIIAEEDRYSRFEDFLSLRTRAIYSIQVGLPFSRTLRKRRHPRPPPHKQHIQGCGGKILGSPASSTSSFCPDITFCHVDGIQTEQRIRFDKWSNSPIPVPIRTASVLPPIRTLSFFL